MLMSGRLFHGANFRMHGQNHWFIKFLLSRITGFIEQQAGASTSFSNYYVNTAGTIPFEIEHILPNTPEEELRVTFEKNNADCEYDDYKVRLGNLTLLEKPINIVAGNGYFSDKLYQYAQCKTYLTSSINSLADVGKNSSITRINKKLQSFSKWDAEDIDRSQDILINLSSEIWKIEPFQLD